MINEFHNLSPSGIGVMGRRPGPGLNEVDVAPNLPALKGGEEVRLLPEVPTAIAIPSPMTSQPYGFQKYFSNVC